MWSLQLLLIDVSAAVSMELPQEVLRSLTTIGRSKFTLYFVILDLFLSHGLSQISVKCTRYACIKTRFTASTAWHRHRRTDRQIMC
jgi:hypothetical protein